MKKNLCAVQYILCFTEFPSALVYENMQEYPVLRTGMNGILSVPLPRWEGLGEGENRKGFSPPPLSSPIKGEEIVFKEIGKPRPVGGVIHLCSETGGLTESR